MGLTSTSGLLCALQTKVPDAPSPSFSPLEGPTSLWAYLHSPPGPYLAEGLCLDPSPHLAPRRKGSRPREVGHSAPTGWEQAEGGFPLEDQSVEVTTIATCRVAAPWRSFILILVFIEAPPPVWRGGEGRDIGCPAPGFLLLLLGTQRQGRRLRIQTPEARIFPSLPPPVLPGTLPSISGCPRPGHRGSTASILGGGGTGPS